MLGQAIDLAGFGGRIIVEKARSLPSVELARGYAFDQAPAWPVNVRLERARVVCIDGFIETVSELHKLFEAAAETKEGVVLFVRGASNDVINTLKVNFDRGSLRIIPIIVKFDIEGINAINDISAAAGCDLVSSHKGDLISNVTLASAPTVDEVQVFKEKVIIVNPTSRKAVETQVAFLRKKRGEEQVHDVSSLYDKRIRSLSPNQVIIRLIDDKSYVTEAQAIDYTLRAIRSLVDYGIVTIDGRDVLTTTAIASDVHARRCFETLTELGASLIQM
jgi:chaperonin GroEL (HSP60 family)